MPAHAGRLRPLERCVFTLVFALMASFVVLVAFMATTTRGHLLLTGPSVSQLPVVAGLNGSTVQDPTGGSGTARSSQTHHAANRPGKVPSPQQLSVVLADHLAPLLGTDSGQLAVGVVDLNSGAAATYNADAVIRGGGIVTTDILAALLLQHQQAGTRLSDHEAELAADMIENDSAAAANQLWAVIGGEQGLAAANATLKLHNTSLTPGAGWTWTRTTVADQLQLLADIAAPRSPLNSASRDYALALMTSVTVAQPWGVLAAATNGTPRAVADGSLVGPRWVIGSIGVIQRHGHELLVAVLSDRNPAESPAVSAAKAAVLAAASTVS
ncbi:MAG TPA: hypothetical protein VH520_09930 [Streptosporangiaceae bacterium]